MYDQCSIRWYTGIWNVYTLHVFVSATSKQLGEIVYIYICSEWVQVVVVVVVVVSSEDKSRQGPDRVSDREWTSRGRFPDQCQGELKEDATFRMYGPGWRQISSTDVQEVKWSLWCNQKWAGIDCLRWVFGIFTGPKTASDCRIPRKWPVNILETRLILAPMSPGGVLWWWFYHWFFFFFFYLSLDHVITKLI